MLTDKIKFVLLGGQAAALSVLLGTTALAQEETVVETPEGNSVTVPEAAETTESPIGTITETDYPILEQWENDEAVAKTLVSQGYTNIHILREGALMTVTAQRDGQPIELVYSVANGSLVSVDGVELRRDEEPSSAETGVASDAVEDEAMPDEDASDDSVTDEEATDDATEATADDGATDGTDDGMTDDGMSDDGTDDGMSDDGTGDGMGGDDSSTGDTSGSDGADSSTGDSGSDSGDGSDSDGGSDSGGGSDSDGGSDGGDSNM